MKNIIIAITEWKNYIPLTCCCSIIIFMIVMLLVGETLIPIPMLLCLLVVSSIGTFILPLCFTDCIIKKMRYSYRVLLFFVLFESFIVSPLVITAHSIQWLFSELERAWLFIILFYILIFAVTLIGFEAYFHLSKRKYDGLLGAYRLEREEEKRGILGEYRKQIESKKKG